MGSGCIQVQERVCESLSEYEVPGGGVLFCCWAVDSVRYDDAHNRAEDGGGCFDVG